MESSEAAKVGNVDERHETAEKESLAGEDIEMVDLASEDEESMLDDKLDSQKGEITAQPSMELEASDVEIIDTEKQKKQEPEEKAPQDDNEENKEIAEGPANSSLEIISSSDSDTEKEKKPKHDEKSLKDDNNENTEIAEGPADSSLEIISSSDSEVVDIEKEKKQEGEEKSSHGNDDKNKPTENPADSSLKIISRSEEKITEEIGGESTAMEVDEDLPNISSGAGNETPPTKELPEEIPATVDAPKIDDDDDVIEIKDNSDDVTVVNSSIGSEADVPQIGEKEVSSTNEDKADVIEEVTAAQKLVESETKDIEDPPIVEILDTSGGENEQNTNKEEETTKPESNKAKKEESTELKKKGSTEAMEEESTEATKEESTEAKKEEFTEATKEESTGATEEDSTEAKKEESTEAMEEDSTEAKKEESSEAMEEDSTEAMEEDSTEATKEESTEAKKEESTEAMESTEATEEESTEATEEDSTEAKKEESTEATEEDSTEAKKAESSEVEVVEETETMKEESTKVPSTTSDVLITELKPSEMKVDETEATADELNSELKTETTSDSTPSNDLKEEAETDSEIYYCKDCINLNCKKTHKQYIAASLAVLNFYKVARKIKMQYVCIKCHDMALEVYEEYAGLLDAKQPLLLRELKQEHTDIVALDSSDEEPDNTEPDKSELSANDLRLIENELQDTIDSILDKIEIKNQLAWSKAILQAKCDDLDSKFKTANAQLSKLQNMSDQMHFSLYNSCKIEHKHLQPLDIYQPTNFDCMQIPPAGEIERPPIKLHETYYAVKNKAIASWVPIRVMEFSETSSMCGGGTLKAYKIKYVNTPYHMVKTLTAKHIAYYEAPSRRLTIGTRVIAYFDGTTLSRGKEKCVVPSAFYPGIIAEPLKQANRFRYLIFYDDGYTQYVQHKDVRLVCHASDKVWEDVHPASRDFIQKYVEKYSVDRPMVQCTRGQSMNTESNGTWLYARVIDIDCSLVLMQFEGDKNHTEWIYRGSLRLGPVFKETQNALNNSALHHQTRVPRRTEPFIRYTKEMEVSNQQVNQQKRAKANFPGRSSGSTLSSSSTSIPSASPSSSSPAVANIVGTQRGGAQVRHLNNSTIYVDDESKNKGTVVFFTAKRNVPPKKYTHHECSPNCLFKMVHRLDSYSPLAKPLLSGWERLILRQKIKRSVVYRGPCGKSLRNLAEVHRYLRATDNILNVDNFDFTPDLHCLAEYSIDPSIVKEADISKGQEKMAIPLVNYYDDTLPPPCVYAKQRIPTEGVNLNLDEEFLVGCDCDDDCSDKSKCSCWQLTVQGVKYCNPNKPIDEIGYQYKRLHEHVPTGIYECNSRCKCKKNCLNRVVQHSLEMKLQVFKTSNRGWGLRCVNDIPKGAFICIYAGHMLTETRANEGGLDAGDEYFADLDYIEVAEQLKEGFESDVEHSEHEEEEDTYVPDAEDDDDFRPTKHYTPRPKNKLRASRSNSIQSNEAESQERAVINFNPNADLDETVRENSVRRLFGKEEAPYIMDAKTTGNLGRYFNHSCGPNLFVQNVFVDTHDLRFPWVAFFSANHIRSGTELTWNYNYEVGVVPGKVLYCQCGSANCRIRLL